MRGSGVWISAVLVGLLLVLPEALGQKSGRYRVVLNNNSVIEGDLTEVEGGYEVKNKYGMLIKLKRSDVRRLEPLGDAKAGDAKAGGAKAGDAKAGGAKAGDAKAGDAKAGGAGEGAGRGAGGAGATATALTDADIEAILGPDAISEADAGVAVVDLAPLPSDADSLAQMLRIAGAGATAETLETPHFVLVYTSDKALARELAARLESVYAWCHKFMEMLGLEPRRPEHKLEIYFFKSHAEFKAYGNNQGGIPDWAAGFYVRENNRSAFYDLNDEPTMAEYKRQLENAHWRRKQYWNNRIKRTSDYFNLSVIQHEAAHHIHFNVGILPRRGDVPRWLAEGLAQMFELPPGNLGGGLGTTNHFRLAEFNRQYNRRYGGNPERITDLRTFIVDDQHGWPEAYPQAWALTHFLWKKKRPQFAAFMQTVAKRPEGKEFSPTERQQEFEDLFGPCDKLQEEFVNYILSLQFRRSALDF